MSPDTNPLELISNLIATLNGGAADRAMSMDMADLVQTIASTGKAGKIGITLTLTPKGINNQNMEVTATHTIKKPSVTPPGSLLFVADGGTLSKKDPYQQQLPTSTKENT